MDEQCKIVYLRHRKLLILLFNVSLKVDSLETYTDKMYPPEDGTGPYKI